MKARVKPIMKEPYMPKVREVDGTKHQMSREDYRQYARANPRQRAEMLVHSGNSGKYVKSIVENFKAAMEEHKEIAQKVGRDDAVVPEALGTSADAVYTDEFKEEE